MHPRFAGRAGHRLSPEYVFASWRPCSTCFFVASGEPAPPVVQHTPAGERTGWALGLRSRSRSTHPAHLPAHFVGCRGRAGAWFGQGGHTALHPFENQPLNRAGVTAGIIGSALAQQYLQRKFPSSAILSFCSAGCFLSAGGLQLIFKAKLVFAALLPVFSHPVRRLG